MLQPHHRLVLLMPDGLRSLRGKTGLGMLRYSELPIVAVIDPACAGADVPTVTGINRAVPIVDSVAAAMPYAPDVLAIGIAPLGGVLPPDVREAVKAAIAQGLSIINGLHTPLATDPTLTQSLRSEQWLWDVRREPPNLQVGTGAARTLNCRRVLLVGTDMAVGKMSASLELHRMAQRQGLNSRFLGTGQAGIMIAGEGVPLDAVRVDFAAGAIEGMVLRHGPHHDILWIEGQGSLFHPASTATLPLLRGSQPTHLILAHRAGQTHIRHQSEIAIPPLPAVCQVYESLVTAGGAFGAAKVVAIALNTAHLTEPEAQAAIAQVQAQTQRPCTDPVRFEATPLLDAVLAQPVPVFAESGT